MGYNTTLNLINITVAPERGAQLRALIRKQRKCRDVDLAWIFHVVRLNRKGVLEFRADVYCCDPSPPLLPQGESCFHGEGKWHASEAFARWLCRHCESGEVMQQSLEGDGAAWGWEFVDGCIREQSVVPVTGWREPQSLPPAPELDGLETTLILNDVTLPRASRGRALRLFRQHSHQKQDPLARFCRAVGLTSDHTLEFRHSALSAVEASQEPDDEGFVNCAEVNWPGTQAFACLLCRAGFSGSVRQHDDSPTRPAWGWEFKNGRIRHLAFAPCTPWERLRPARKVGRIDRQASRSHGC